MSGPRLNAQHFATAIGNRGDAGFIHDFTRDALLLSEGHFRTKTGAWSGGGPFFVCKRRISHGQSSTIPIQVGFGAPWFVDLLVTSKGVAGIDSQVPPDLASQEQAQLNANMAALPGYYASGYAKARPGNPVASVGQFIGELHSLPAIPGKALFPRKWRFNGIPTGPIRTLPARLFAALTNFRALGSEYLNVQFGWKPFVSDLRKMYYLWQTLDQRMAQLVRENGRNIRRRVTLEKDESVDTSSTVFTYPYANVYGAPPTYMSGTTIYTTRQKTSTRIWFSAGFRYYIPDVGSSLWTARAKASLFGAIPTPEVVWELLPWSWLIDWFSNVGDVVSNLSVNAVDNLVTNYSFTMKEYSVETTHSAYVSHGASSGFYNWPAVSHTFSSTDSLTTKARLGGGNPFGLNVQLADLSPYQLSILAALGLSRSKVR